MRRVVKWVGVSWCWMANVQRGPLVGRRSDLLRSDPNRPWHGRDVAQILNVTNINSLCTRMSQRAHKGLLHKIGRATHTLAPTP